MPQTFTDAEGRKWSVVLNVALAKRVRLACGVDVYRLADDGLKPLAALLADPITLVDVLYVLAGAGDKSVSEESFGGAISGDVIQAAADCFVEALVDFFPDPAKRAALRGVLEKGKRLQALLAKKGQADLAGLSPEKLASRLIRRLEAAQRKAEEAEEKELQTLLGGTPKAPPSGSSGTAPASSESTPGPAPSAS